MGLYEDLLERIRAVPESAGFPAALPASDRDQWDWPRLTDLPETMLPPHMRKKSLPAVDATAIGIQSALGNQPIATPGMPAIFQNAGMLPSLNPNEPIGLTDAEKTMGAQGAEVPMPRARPVEAPVAPLPEPTTIAPPTVSVPTGATDFSSQNRAPGPIQIAPTAVSAPTPAAGMIDTGGSILDRIRNTLGDNSNTLLAIGAGFAGAPNIGQGISRASAAAIPARAADVNQSLARTARQYGTQALIDAGVPRQLAISASGDPDLKKALIQNYIVDRKSEIKSVKSKDAFGNETERLYSVNPFTNESKEITLGGDKGGRGAAAGGKNATFADGVTSETFDHSKVGDEYLSQFSPEMQSDIKSYLEGRSIPTGKQQSANVIKQIAKKYGDDIGMPGDDTAISQRKEWATSLANTKSGVGLSSKGFKQGLEHFVGLSDNLVKMNLSNGLGLEPIAGLVNSAKNLTTEQKMLVNKNDVFGQALSREMGNLFAKNGGGVHEAAETKKNISNSVASSKAAAGSLEAIDELMQGGLRTLEHRRDELFPNGNAPKGSEFLGPEQKKQLEHIRRNIAILKGEQNAAQAPPAAAAPVAKGMVKIGDQVIPWSVN